MNEIIKKYAFSESIWAIPDAIKEERWQLILPDGTTPIKNKPSMPITLLQKQWLKAIGCDPRIKLFGDFDFDYADVEPLFYQRIILFLTNILTVMILQTKIIFRILD